MSEAGWYLDMTDSSCLLVVRGWHIEDLGTWWEHTSHGRRDRHIADIHPTTTDRPPWRVQRCPLMHIDHRPPRLDQLMTCWPVTTCSSQPSCLQQLMIHKYTQIKASTQTRYHTLDSSCITAFSDWLSLLTKFTSNVLKPINTVDLRLCHHNISDLS